MFNRVEVMHINTYCGESADNGETELQYRIDIDRRIFSVIISGVEHPAEPYWVTLRERTGMHVTGPSNGLNSRVEVCVHGTSVIDAVFAATQAALRIVSTEPAPGPASSDIWPNQEANL
jgi:hypothetical protein